MTKIYTKTGDKGETSLSNAARVSKLHPRIVAFGSIDEINSLIGIARSQNPSARIDKILKQIQEDLFVLGSDLAMPEENSRKNIPRIKSHHVNFLERTIDACTDKLSPLKNFILPGGSPLGATLHMARSVARRAERKVIKVHEAEELNPVILEYANRLSDCLFVLSRLANFEAGVEDTLWVP